MNTFKKRMLVTAIIAVLAVIGTLMNSQSTVRAAGGPTVTIDPTQLPLPVQGSLGASGSVAATQSGPWSVGLSGTPNVNVANPATAPVLALNVSDPGRIAYQAVTLSTTCVGNSCLAVFPTVPAKHRLVIQHATANGFFSNSPTSAAIQLQVGNSLQTTYLSTFTATDTLSVASNNVTVFDRQVLIYCDAGMAVLVGLVPLPPGNVTNASFALTGYMLDCSIAPCAAIAP